MLTVDFTLAGHDMVALNGGPEFPFTEAISLSVAVRGPGGGRPLWASLLGGGEPSVCGWLKDKFGVSWQIIPKIMPEPMNGPDPAGAERAMQAMLKMTKLDVERLRDV